MPTDWTFADWLPGLQQQFAQAMEIVWPGLAVALGLGIAGIATYLLADLVTDILGWRRGGDE